MNKSLLLIGLLASLNANAAVNLIQDGSFESYALSADKEYQHVYVNAAPGSCPSPNGFVAFFGVTSSCSGDATKDWKQATGVADPYMEVQRALLTTAQDGVNYVELNADAKGGIQQTFSATAGVDGVLSWYAQRADVNAFFGTNNANIPTPYSVLFNGNTVGTFDTTFDTAGVWNLRSINISGANILSSGNVLSFVSDIQNIDFPSTAILIDNVSFVQQSTTSVPEPETYGMMMLGLAMLGFASRRRKV